MVIEERERTLSPSRPRTLEKLEALSQEILLRQAELASLVSRRSEYEDEWVAGIQSAMNRRDDNERQGGQNNGALNERSKSGGSLRLRLYVAGQSPSSMLALANLKALSRAYPMSDWQLDVIDALKEPLRALEDGVLATPTLVRLWPEPLCRVVGDLSRTEDVLLALGVEPAAP
jgi:circadian clock protein KaiB